HVRRTEQRLDIPLDPKERVPEKIPHTTTHKNHHSEYAEVIAWGERLPPPPSTCSPVHQRPDQSACHGQEASVEGDMPGREKGRIDLSMRVRPAINVGPADQPGRQAGNDPVKPLMLRRPRRLGALRDALAATRMYPAHSLLPGLPA